MVLLRDAYFQISCDHKPVFYCLLLSILLDSNWKPAGCTKRRWTTQVCNPSCTCCASSEHKNQSLPWECGHPDYKAEDYTTKCSSRIGDGEKNKFWASIDHQQPSRRNGWFGKASPGNRTSKDQRPRGESKEASWVGEENWSSATPKWAKLSIWWSGSFWVTFIFCWVVLMKTIFCCFWSIVNSLGMLLFLTEMGKLYVMQTLFMWILD